MKVYTPRMYAEKVEHGLVCSKTVINWIKANKLVGRNGVSKIEVSPYGRYMIVIENEAKSKVDKKFQDILERKAWRAA
ncbi:conserved hypothetical protein [Alteromonas macleodii]|tara:strand:+ start:5683 stop:5916 length:234 start_codon:yes stop_codon:yes gene_type:complete